ncbi:hypothetical protein LIER_25977 [Lithospermum erythrorhizon]|uniref:Uncharacterized protein n=1 Tax=Lithospermum erythrorhizon TaxID=34254 RepID=A0AAV3R898_LITER
MSDSNFYVESWLFGGLALLFAMISTALIILFCYNKKQNQQSNEEENKQSDIKFGTSPKFAVIMAGYEKPTHIAIPVQDYFVAKVP